MAASTGPLTWHVFQSEPTPTLVDEPAPGQRHRIWPPVSSTLISGHSDAVLVDVPITAAQATALADQAAATGTTVKTIYVTHGHLDHWISVSVLLDHFTSARAVALPAVVEQMRRHSTPKELDLWRRRFPGQLADQITVPEELTDAVIELEGHQLVPVPLGHTDMDDTTCLHAPSIDLIAAGDAVYNDVFLQLRESSPQKRQEWITALDTIDALQPRAVIAGHKRPGSGDDPGDVEETRQYIRVFDAILQEAETAREVYDMMISRYPGRLYPDALWASARELMK
jgi:glyoxylase-like metal-dependent hydrolase (beta-lactamase superfamily II)